MTKWQRIKYEWRIFTLFLAATTMTEAERKHASREFARGKDRCQ